MGSGTYNSQMEWNSRRQFLRTTTLAMTAASYSRVMGANNRINLGLIGAGDRGNHVMSLFQNRADVHVTAVCDAWGERVESTRQKTPGAAGFSDHRKLLDTSPLDAVLIATPDHWHSRIAIDALNAGKDVYVEKPLTRTIEEGPQGCEGGAGKQSGLPGGHAAAVGPALPGCEGEILRHGTLGGITMATNLVVWQ